MHSHCQKDYKVYCTILVTRQLWFQKCGGVIKSGATHSLETVCCFKVCFKYNISFHSNIHTCTILRTVSWHRLDTIHSLGRYPAGDLVLSPGGHHAWTVAQRSSVRAAEVDLLLALTFIACDWSCKGSVCVLYSEWFVQFFPLELGLLVLVNT